ncbi:MAG: plastocyanin/azurin family copper-binding protein [Holophagaceae bacterium]
MRPRPTLLALLLLAATASLPSCGGGGGYGGSSGGNTGNPPPNTIYVGGTGAYGTVENVFQPANLTVARGTTVTFVWQSSGHDLHSGTGCSPDGLFGSNGLQGQGFQTSYTFNTAGAFPFYCGSHCASSNMKGTVTVQ